MVRDRIEREVFIQAVLDLVWSLVSKAGFWAREELHFDVDAGEGKTAVIEVANYRRLSVRVERLEPPRFAPYRWASGFPDADLSDANSTLVEFTLSERGGGVLLRVHESGFATLLGADGTDEYRDARRDHNAEAWGTQLERLREAVQRVAA